MDKKEELLQNIGKLLKTEINQPKIIQKVKWLIYDIVGLEDALKTDEQKQLKDDDTCCFLIHKLIQKNVNLIESVCVLFLKQYFKKGGAISYGLPKIASYNRTFADECLRKKIELMNLLLLNCQRDMLLQTMFFGATKNLTKNENTNETNQKQESQEEEEKKVSNETLLKPQDKQNLGDSSIFDSAAKSSKENILSSKNNQAIEEPSIFQKNDSKVDPKDEERERKLAWIEKLQSQISQTVEQQSNQKQESQQEQQQIDNNQTQQETSNDNQ